MFITHLLSHTTFTFPLHSLPLPTLPLLPLLSSDPSQALPSTPCHTTLTLFQSNEALCKSSGHSVLPVDVRRTLSPLVSHAWTPWRFGHTVSFLHLALTHCVLPQSKTMRHHHISFMTSLLARLFTELQHAKLKGYALAILPACSSLSWHL